MNTMGNSPAKDSDAEGGGWKVILAYVVYIIKYTLGSAVVVVGFYVGTVLAVEAYHSLEVVGSCGSMFSFAAQFEGPSCIGFKLFQAATAIVVPFFVASVFIPRESKVLAGIVVVLILLAVAAGAAPLFASLGMPGLGGWLVAG